MVRDELPLPGGEPVVEPEVLDSLEEAERTRHASSVHSRQVVLGPGCGCIGLPLALIAGAVLTAFMALLWLLSLGRVPVSVVRLAQRLRQGRGQG